MSVAARAAWLALLAACAMAGSCSPAVDSRAAAVDERPQLGLMTTLPILWGESDDFDAMLDAEAEPHWVRAEIEREYEIRPLDVLDRQSLEGLELLVLAQPRVLSPAENVALDDWVREGGRALVFADPLLTGHSEYGFGDKRRPQDVALLDAILARWGLVLEPRAPQLEIASVPLGEGELPYLAEGSFVARQPAGDGDASCRLRFGGLLARCAIGGGTAVLVADATLLEERELHFEEWREGFSALLGMVGEKPTSGPGTKGD